MVLLYELCAAPKLSLEGLPVYPVDYLRQLCVVDCVTSDVHNFVLNAWLREDLDAPMLAFLHTSLPGIFHLLFQR